MAPLPSSNVAEANLGPDEDIGDYRAVSGLAVVGLILAILSATAFIHPLLWLAAWTAALVNGVALRRIGEANSRLIGRKAALIGLAVSLICSIGAPVQFIVHRRQLRREAVEIAREWFDYLRDNRPEMAHRMSQFPQTKAARGKSPLPDYEAGSAPLEPLRGFIQESPVDLLLKLGKRAHIRLYENDDVWSSGGMEGVRDVYVVTVGEDNQPTSFFLRLGTTRSADLATGEWQWQVTLHEFRNEPPPGLEDVASGG